MMRDRFIGLKVSDEEKEVLERAAFLTGTSLSHFMRWMAVQAARKTLKDHGEIPTREPAVTR